MPNDEDAENVTAQSLRSHLVSADFVGRVTIGDNTVRAHHNGVNALVLHQDGHHRVTDQRTGNVLRHQLVRGQAGALKTYSEKKICVRRAQKMTNA